MRLAVRLLTALALLAGVVAATVNPASATLTVNPSQMFTVNSINHDGNILGISCVPAVGAAPAGCMSVGTNEGLQHPLFATGYSVQTPGYADALGGRHNFEAVDCLSSVSCVAVGWADSQTDSGHPYIMEYASGTWTSAGATADPPDIKLAAGNARLWSIDCFDIDNCIAVGSYQATTSDAYWAFSASKVNGTWSSQRVTVTGELVDNGPWWEGSALRDLSCISSTLCVATGFHRSSSGSHQPFVATATLTNGAWAWTTTAVSVPGATGLSGDGKVSCSSTGYCMAIDGMTQGTTPTNPAYALEFSNGAWSSSPIIFDDGAGHDVWAWDVSCPDTGICYAVGSQAGNAGLVWEFTDGVPTVVTVNKGTYGTFFNSIDCPTMNSCAAWGEGDETNNGDVWDALNFVAVRENGTWTVAPQYSVYSQNVADSNAVVVECTIEGVCLAGGNDFGGSWRATVTPFTFTVDPSTRAGGGGGGGGGGGSSTSTSVPEVSIDENGVALTVPAFTG